MTALAAVGYLLLCKLLTEVNSPVLILGGVDFVKLSLLNDLIVLPLESSDFLHGAFKVVDLQDMCVWLLVLDPVWLIFELLSVDLVL